MRQKFETVQDAVHVYRASGCVVWVAFFASLALQAGAVFYFFFVARALDIPLPLGAAFVMVPLCLLVQAVPISFNGWGMRESLFIVYFGQIGLGRDSALAFSLVGAGLTVLLSLSGAVIWTTRESHTRRSPPTEAMAVPVLHVCDKFGVAGSSIHGVSRLFSWWFPRYDPPLRRLAGAA